MTLPVFHPPFVSTNVSLVQIRQSSSRATLNESRHQLNYSELIEILQHAGLYNKNFVF